MHIIRSWQEFADWLKGPTCYAVAALLNTRRAHLEQYGEDQRAIGTPFVG